jgi:hypothetical protein
MKKIRRDYKGSLIAQLIVYQSLIIKALLVDALGLIFCAAEVPRHLMW